MDGRRPSSGTGYRIRLTDGLASLECADINAAYLHARRSALPWVPMIPGPSAAKPWGVSPTPYIEIGGEDVVRELAENFYDVIDEESPDLAAMLPANTSNTRRKFYMYLTGWLGGPPLYQDQYGHPRLRMRHMPFPIGKHEAEEWLRCMRIAMDRVGIEGSIRAFLEDRFEPLAAHMRNQED